MPVITFTDTNPKLILHANAQRKRVQIQMQPSTVDSDNTDQRVHVGRGFQPSTTVGAELQGLVLTPGASIDEPGVSNDLDESYKQNVWATATAAGVSIIVEEE